jgi:hypothetical protein
MRHFHYDPFSELGGRESCTVAALRARAVGHDIEIRSQLRDNIAKRGTLATDLMVPASAR